MLKDHMSRDILAVVSSVSSPVAVFWVQNDMAPVVCALCAATPITLGT